MHNNNQFDQRYYCRLTILRYISVVFLFAILLFMSSAIFFVQFQEADSFIGYAEQFSMVIVPIFCISLIIYFIFYIPVKVIISQEMIVLQTFARKRIIPWKDVQSVTVVPFIHQTKRLTRIVYYRYTIQTNNSRIRLVSNKYSTKLYSVHAAMLEECAHHGIDCRMHPPALAYKIGPSRATYVGRLANTIFYVLLLIVSTIIHVYVVHYLPIPERNMPAMYVLSLIPCIASAIMVARSVYQVKHARESNVRTYPKT